MKKGKKKPALSEKELRRLTWIKKKRGEGKRRDWRKDR